MSFEKLGSKLWSFFSESDGMGSMSRLLGFISLVAVIVWVGYVVFTTRTIPDLHNPAYFLSASNIPYGANKLHDAVTNIFGTNEKT